MSKAATSPHPTPAIRPRRRGLQPEEKLVAYSMRANERQAKALNRAGLWLGFSSGGALVRAFADLGDERLYKIGERYLPKVGE